MLANVIDSETVRARRAARPAATLSLTFDDGPDARWTGRVLDSLDAAGAKATFFVVGERVREQPEMVREVLREGHEVQLHCDRHVRHSQLSEREIERDTRDALATLEDLGVHASRWRTPWGVRVAGSMRVARAHGLALTHWTIDTHDWRGDEPAAMLAAARPALAGGGVVLMHDALGPGARRAGCENTARLVERLVPWAREHGLRVGPLSLQPAELAEAS
ncbi:MAG TPA: polysaccharide deacetylase family protein [Solirubrobacteraceae bacterium]|nr:polysaccharide deacetylase family protein [Solirubrobacteraceae bacterium]